MLQLSMQLVAMGSQSPGIWQSQLAAAAVRQMSNTGHGGGSASSQNVYPQNELQVQWKIMTISTMLPAQWHLRIR
jgi:hypothetical protein